MAELARGYASIVKTNKNDDGTMTVYGKATDSSIDIDQQICDETWLKEAMPQWMVSGGNIREQHSSIAAGVATEYEATPDGHYITALVVDPVSVKKVELGVLKGFSIGIRGPRVIRDTKAAGGRIVDGQIVEISLVDRPANPNAKLMLAKASEAGELEVVKQITIPSPKAVADLVKFDPDQERDEGGRFGSGGGSSSESTRNSEDVRNAEVSVQRLLDGKAGDALNETQDLAGRLGSEDDVAYHERAEGFVSEGEDKLLEARESFSEGRNDNAFTALERAAGAYEKAGAWFDKGSDERMTEMANNMFAIASQINEVLSANKSATTDSKVEVMNTIDKSEADESIIDEPEIVTVVEVIEEDNEPANSLAEVKTLVGSLVKFDQRKYDQACAALAGLIVVEANEMKAGSEEVRSIELLLASIKALHEWYEGEVAEGEVPGGSLQPENGIEEMYMAAEPKESTEPEKPVADKEDGMCADCELEKAECKCADKAAELDVDDAVVSAIIDKAVASAKASVVEEIDLLKTALEAEKVKAIQLEGELETAKKAVAPTGPKRSGNAPAIDTNALLLKAAEYTQKAKVTTDPTLAKGYRELAKDLITTSKQGE